MPEATREIQHIVENRKASFQFHIVDCHEAGIQLTGTEIKSVRQKKASLQEGYCFFHRGELFVKNMHISEYKQGNIYNHEPKRVRKLLMRKHELTKLHAKVAEKGMTIVPKSLFINERGLAKLEVCAAKGKKVFDKRQAIKEKEMKREMQRKMKY